MPRKLTNDCFIERLKKINPDIIPREKYINRDTKILCECLKCGNLWMVAPHSLFNSNGGCPTCRDIKLHNERTMPNDVFAQWIIDNNPTVILLSEYKGMDKNITCQCSICGEKWITKAGNLKDKTACPYCADKKVIDKLTLTNKEFTKLLAVKNNLVEALEEYKGNKVKIKFRCKKCGNIFFATPHDILSGHGCPICKISLGEKIILKFLVDNNIDYITQYKFNDCKYKKVLPFDFYLPQYNICIEYDGQQHFKPVGFGSKDKQKVIENYNLTQKRDSIKTQYCIDHNITLLRIPYTEFNNINIILQKNIIL